MRARKIRRGIVTNEAVFICGSFKWLLWLIKKAISRSWDLVWILLT